MERSACLVITGCIARRGSEIGPTPPKLMEGTLAGNKTTIAPAAVRFAPDRAAFAWEMNSLEHIAESLAFWASRLQEMTCPECGVKRTLELHVLPYAIEIVCRRSETDRCNYSQEVEFREQQ